MVLVDLKVVRKGKTMVDGNQLCGLFHPLFVGTQLLNHQNVCLIPVTVKDSQIEYGYFMDLLHIKLVAAQIAS